MSRILILDDEEPILKSLNRLLRAVPCRSGDVTFPIEPELFSDPHAAVERARHRSFDLVLTDYRMPAMNGVEFLRQFKVIQPDCARLILSGYSDLNALTRAVNEIGIERFIAKPWNDYELVTSLAQCLSSRALTMENKRLADLARLAAGQLSAEDLERARLEAMEPGITQVNWGPDGSVILDPEFRDPSDNDG
jgi:two-component system, probable response regulator PhcQ